MVEHQRTPGAGSGYEQGGDSRGECPDAATAALDAEFRPRLAAELSAARVTAVRLAASMKDVSDARDGANVDDEHDPEGATIAFERGQLDGIRRGTLARIAALEAALGRLDAGRYGRCAVDGAPIPLERLRAVPEAATCVSHA